MDDQLISFEVGKLAKTKMYNQNPFKTNHSYGPNFIDGSDIRLRSSLFNPETNICVVPTQSELQTWIRKNHNIHIEIKLNQFGYGYMYALIDIEQCECVKFLTGGPNHKFSYEEALEEGLKESLKLIK